ncbi:MAG: cob(I)yrinic acid a,c-diamide adenosyltransferase [Candidatus Micrarchaeota archaeon]|nr:cob(I)yrinic acid a,c-diamide adenosyltransferase [Candidatus Micrarchaeota archaeon]
MDCCGLVTLYYTGKGDKGDTGVLANCRVTKDNELVEAIGAVDELNSHVGTAILYIHDENVRMNLKLIQNDLFIIGAGLASAEGAKIKKAELGREHLERLEREINAMGRELPELRKFVLPGGGEGAVHLHMARAVARRAERRIVSASKRYKIEENVLAYANRLSSFFFVAALYLNYKEGVEEAHPTY